MGNTTYNKELCEERKKKVNEVLENHEKRLDDQDKRINSVDRNMGIYGTRIDNLVTTTQALVDTLKWLNRLVIATLLTTIGSIVGLLIQSSLK